MVRPNTFKLMDGCGEEASAQIVQGRVTVISSSNLPLKCKKIYVYQETACDVNKLNAITNIFRRNMFTLVMFRLSLNTALD